MSSSSPPLVDLPVIPSQKRGTKRPLTLLSGDPDAPTHKFQKTLANDEEKQDSYEIYSRDGGKVKKKEFKKDQLVALVIHRRLPGTASKHRSKTYEQLIQDLGTITDQEKAFLKKRDANHRKYAMTSNYDLRRRILGAGYSVSTGLTRSYLIDLIEQMKIEAIQNIKYDPDQQAFLDRLDRYFDTLMISAGPGSGKTTTLTGAAMKLASSRDFTTAQGTPIKVKKEDVTVFVLAFNVAAAETMTRRILAAGGTVHSNRVKLDPWGPAAGIFCMTFNKLAYRIISTAKGKEFAEQVPLDFQISLATEILKEKPLVGHWTHLLIDEGQDVGAEKEDFVKALRRGAQHTIIAGDPRQEIYPGAQWYSNLWTKSRADCKMYLRYNHRSNAKLIELFNKFSKRYFTTLHHTQLVGATGSTNSESKQTEKQDSKEEQKSLIPFLTETETKSVSSTSPIPASMDSSADAEHDAIVNVTETKNSQTETPDEKKGNSGVSLIIVPRERMGDALAVELMKHKPKDVYVIAPISVEKYNMGQIMLEARNRLVRSRCKYPLYTLTEYAKYNPQDNVYFAGSSMKLKGTEKKTVIMVGSEIPYDACGIRDEKLLKYFYVCMSRAIDHLILILPSDVKVAEDSPPGHIISMADQHFKFTEAKKAEKKYLDSVRVKDDLSKTNCLPIQYERFDGPKMLDKQFAFNSDFAGIFVEALVAICLENKETQRATRPWRNILLHPEKNIRLLGSVEAKQARTFVEKRENGNEYILLLKPFETKTPPPEVIDCIHSDNLLDQAYALAVVLFTSRIGKWWVASREVLEAFKNCQSSLQRILQDLPSQLELEGQELLSWGRPVTRPVYCERSGLVGCTITGALDLEFEQLQLEIKFAQWYDAHVRQTAIYSDICKKPGRILNLLAGAITNVETINRRELDRFSRLWLAIRNASGNDKIRVRVPNISGAILISVDTETDGFPSNGLLLETGMCAWYAGSDNILGTFSQTAQDVVTSEESISGLIPGPDYCSTALKEDANTFVSQILGRKVAIVFGGCDDVKCAGLSASDFDQVIDVRTIYRTYLELNGCMRSSNTTLGDCVAHLFGDDFVWEGHTAFEDALATGLVMVAITDFEGTL